ncbi:MAG: AraC family transcriptional regulator [Ruminococcaceae bacterium]|nr:AraC family transcriptional regulator [Oscillospiraceae bacterium]
MTANIRYLYNSDTGIECIYCVDSNISYPLHNHVSVLTVGIVLEGTVVLTSNQGTRAYGKNDMFTILPYEPHTVSADKNYTMLSLCIDKNIIKQCSADMIYNNIADLLTNVSNIEEADCCRIMRLLRRKDMLVGFSDWKYVNPSPFINDLKCHLELFPEIDISIDEMARKAFISKFHFIRRFKAEVGLSPHRFQIQNRIRKAQRLIHQTETITEVALTTGFYDQSHFIKQFEKCVGLSPMAYKSSSDIIRKDTAGQHKAGINFANR